MKYIIITGQIVELIKLDRSDLKGVYVDAMLRFDFYRGRFGEHSFVLLKSRKDEILKPLHYKQIADNLGKVFQRPILFEFDKLETYRRNRFIERGVHFIVSDKYVFLPFLIINAKNADRIANNKLTPVAQYVLLSQIQHGKLDNLTIKEIEKITPYKYVTLTRAIRVLEELGLCNTIIKDDRTKHLQFAKSKELWNSAQDYFINPIAKVVYCNETNANIICSYNALSHYTNLNPDNKQHVAIYEKEYKDFERNSKGVNDYDGVITIEVWKYPPIDDKYVDKLSLYLTLNKEKDPRVENELEKMISELW